MILTWRRAAIIAVIWIVSVLLHNILPYEDALFFIIAIFIIPGYVIISLIYTIIKKLRGD